MLLAGCTGTDFNPLRRLSQEQQIDALRLQDEDLIKERQRIELAIHDDHAATQVLRDEAVGLAISRRELVLTVAHERFVLAAARQDLLVAQALVLDLGKQLAPLLDQEQRLKDFAARSADLPATVVAAEAALSLLQKDVEAKLALLQQRATAMQAVSVAVQAAIAAAQSAGVLPPAVPPGVPPAVPPAVTQKQ